MTTWPLMALGRPNSKVALALGPSAFDGGGGFALDARRRAVMPS